MNSTETRSCTRATTIEFAKVDAALQNSPWYISAVAEHLARSAANECELVDFDDVTVEVIVSVRKHHSPAIPAAATAARI